MYPKGAKTSRVATLIVPTGDSPASRLDFSFQPSIDERHVVVFDADLRPVFRPVSVACDVAEGFFAGRRASWAFVS